MDWTHLWNQAVPLLQQFCTIVIFPLLVAFIKSEKMALDNTTQASGIVHWFKLANKAMAIVPESVINSVEVKADALVPGAGQIVEALTKEDANVQTTDYTNTPAPGV